jgi:hypothetical protein
MPGAAADDDFDFTDHVIQAAVCCISQDWARNPRRSGNSSEEQPEN